MPLSTNDLRHHAFTLDISVSQGHPERLSGKRGSVHRSTAEFYLIPRVILGLLHFALFLCPCEVAISSPKQSQKLLSRNRIASLRSQRRRKRPSDCFGPLALAMTGESHCEVVVSPFFLCHCEPRLFAPHLSLRASLFRLAKQSQRFLAASRLGMTEEGVIASLVCSFGEAIS